MTQLLLQSWQKEAALGQWQLISSSQTASSNNACQAVQSDSSLDSHELETEVSTVSVLPAAAEVTDQGVLVRALQGWRAVAMHMTRRREEMQLAALQSADRAVRKGCDAAASRDCTVTRGGDCNQTVLRLMAIPSRRSSPGSGHPADAHVLPAHGAKGLEAVELIQDVADTAPNCSRSSMQAAAEAVSHPVSSLQPVHYKAHASDAQANRLYIALLLSKAFKGWQSLAQGAVAMLYQQHELKARTNQQLLQVSVHETQKIHSCEYLLLSQCMSLLGYASLFSNTKTSELDAKLTCASCTASKILRLLLYVQCDTLSAVPCTDQQSDQDCAYNGF